MVNVKRTSRWVEPPPVWVDSADSTCAGRRISPLTGLLNLMEPQGEAVLWACDLGWSHRGGWGQPRRRQVDGEALVEPRRRRQGPVLAPFCAVGRGQGHRRRRNGPPTTPPPRQKGVLPPPTGGSLGSPLATAASGTRKQPTRPAWPCCRGQTPGSPRRRPRPRRRRRPSRSGSRAR